MNQWTQQSIELANAPGYLDKLHSVYVMNVNLNRPLSAEHEKAIREAFTRKDTPSLVKLLISGEVFPVKDSYVGFLRLKPAAIEENPLTISRIGERLYSMGLEAVLREATRPKETNRQLGQAFKNYLRTLGIPFLNRSELLKTTDISFLEGSDATLKKFAEEELDCRLNKGIDFVLKKNGSYLIGEAKFLTTPGGEQNGGFADASSFIKQEVGNAKRIALIDGYVWLKSSGGLHGRITENDLDIFSTLLLKDYIEAFK